MEIRNFEKWLNTFTDTVATWDYYVDFEKVYANVEKIRRELNILNSLVGRTDIRNEFISLVDEYPKVVKCIPILLAKRGREIVVKSPEKEYYFNFENMNYSIDEYLEFMEKSGLLNLIQNRVINNLVDYVMGVEVGLDTNARKNRTGHSMEDLVEEFIKDSGYIYGETYFKECKKSTIEEMWGIDLSKISNDGKTEKRFDFVIKTENHIYAIETNFYCSGGSKLNETARSYKNITMEAAEIEGFTFVWITDGNGWNSAKRNLRETFDVLPYLYNIKDMTDGILEKIFK